MEFQASGNFYRSLFDNTLDGLAYCQMFFNAQGQPIDFIYIEVNKNFENLTGLKDVVGKKFSELIPKITTSDLELIEIYNRVSLTGKPERFDTYIEPVAKWFLISVYSPQKKHFVAVFQDITDRKRMEKNLESTKIAVRNVLEDLRHEKETLAYAKARDEAVLSSIGDGMIATGPDRRIIIMNKVAEKLLGWKVDEAIGKLYDDIVLLEDEEGTFVPPDERPLTKAFGDRTTTTGLYLLSKNKIKFPVAITVSPIILDNKIIGAVEVFRDITHEREINQAKDDFLSIAAHDLRTPMSGIRANTEMILAGDYGEIPPKFKIPLEDIEKANLNLIKMVNDFLTISRIEKGKITVIPKPVDLVPILNAIVRQMKPLVEETGLKFYNLKFNSVIPAKLPLVLADADKIPEVLTNFLDNAIKFTDKGSISLSAAIKDDSVMVKVVDTGIGITKERQKDLFQKYTQVGTKERIAYGKGTGLGLGLYISRLIIEGCGGKIWVESEHGKGSTFYFSLPIAKK